MTTHSPKMTLAHPVHKGRRFQISARTEKELAGLAESVRRLRREVRAGARTKEDALALLGKAAPVVALQVAIDRHATTLKPRTRRVFANVCANYLGPLRGMYLDDLTDLQLRKWETWMRGQGYAASTVELAFGFVRAAVLGARVKAPWGSYAPAAGPARAYEKCATVAELLRLLQAANVRDVTYARETGQLADLTRRIALAVLCGWRKGEQCAAGWDDIDDRGVLTIRHQVTDGWRKEHPEWTRPEDAPKGGGVRRIRLHPIALVLLEWQREDLIRHGVYAEDGPIFPGRGGRWRDTPEIIRWGAWRAIVAEAGLPNADDWVLHSLRHSLASLEDAAGASPEQVRARTGHASIAMTERYIRGTARHLPPSRIGRAAERDPDTDRIVLQEELAACESRVRNAYEIGRRAVPARARAARPPAEGPLAGVPLAELARQYVLAEKANEAPGGSAAMKRIAKEITRRCGRAYHAAWAKETQKTRAREAGRAARYAARHAWQRALLRARTGKR